MGRLGAGVRKEAGPRVKPGATGTGSPGLLPQHRGHLVGGLRACGFELAHHAAQFAGGEGAVAGGRGGGEGYRIVRTVFGRSILLGLEFLVAGDIIRTVAVQPSLQNVAVLGLIVLIRTFLSFSLEVEIDGRWPWRRAGLEQAASSPASPDSREPGGP